MPLNHHLLYRKQNISVAISETKYTCGNGDDETCISQPNFRRETRYEVGDRNLTDQ